VIYIYIYVRHLDVMNSHSYDLIICKIVHIYLYRVCIS